jgi:hypothetical protein
MDDDLDPLKRPRHPAREPVPEWFAAPPGPVAPPPSHDSERVGAQVPPQTPTAEPDAAAADEPRRPRFVPVPTTQRSPLKWGIAAGLLAAGVVTGAAWLVMDINRHSALLASIARDVQVPLNAPRTAADTEAPMAVERRPLTDATAPVVSQPAAKTAAVPSASARPKLPSKTPASQPAAAPDPHAACGHRTPFWTAVCLQSRCASDTYRAHASCVQLRHQEEQHRLDRELGG